MSQVLQFDTRHYFAFWLFSCGIHAPNRALMNRREIFILLAFLILGAALRFQGQAEMQHLLHHDEAYYGLDALSLLENPRLQLYFPANTGREGLWMVLLTPLLGTLGATPLALRLTSAFVGILTIAAVYWLAREFYKDGAVWSA